MNRKNLTAAVLAGLAGAAGIVGSAQAVNINPDGLGQVLVYPYYTVNGGNITLLSVVNTSEDAKAVKVRFLEGQNSREVLDFNLYMSKYDVWTASLKWNAADEAPRMKTGDNSCTVPYIYGNGGTQNFLPWALNDGYYNDLKFKSGQDAGIGEGKATKEYDDIIRGAEGHFEMIEMGTLVDMQVENGDWVDIEIYPFCVVGSPDVWGNPSDNCPVGLDREWTAGELDEPQFLTPYGSATAATHVEGVPADCQQLVDAWTYGATSDDDGYWLDNNYYDIERPSGGLFGGAAVVNVQNGTMYSYDAKAIDGFYPTREPMKLVDYDESHQEPGTILPSLDSGGNADGIVFFNGNEQHSYPLNRGVDAVSYVFMHDQLMNEYTTETAVGAGTEWVITFPTKQFYVHEPFLDDYADLRDNGKLDGSDSYDGPDLPLAPFTSEWYWKMTTYEEDGTIDKAGKVVYPCEVVTLNTIWDREEQTIIDPTRPPGTPVPPIVSPAPPPGSGPDPDGIIPFELCYETSVIEFGPESDGPTAILGSANFHNIDNSLLGFEYGWARLDMVDASWDDDEDGDLDCDYNDAEGWWEGSECDFREDLGGLFGLPVTGFAVQRFQNAFLGDGADTLANYGGIFQHKYTRTMTSRPQD